MGLESFKPSDAPAFEPNKIEAKESKDEPIGKVGLILDRINSGSNDVQDKKIIKQLLLRTQKATDLLGKWYGKEISGKHKETTAFDRQKNRRNAAAQGSIHKEYADMTNKDKVNVLFDTFAEPLISRLDKEKVDMTKISDEDFDRVYANITKEMLQAYIDMKLKILSSEIGG